jgi:hypothetical protein
VTFGKQNGWWPFALLCGVAGGRWALNNAWPETTSTVGSQAIACGAVAAALIVEATLTRRKLPGIKPVLGLLLIGAGLLAAPALGEVLHGVASDAPDRIIALCMVPVIVAVLSGQGGTGNLWPGLAGLGGAMLVFPLALSSGVSGYVELLLPSVAIAAACVACRRTTQGVAAEWSAGLMFTGGALGLIALSAVRSGSMRGAASIWAVALDALVAGLVVLSVIRMEPLQYSARYFVVPLLFVVEDLFVSGLGLREAMGVVLLAAASMGLLKRQVTDGGTSVLSLK